MGKFGRAIFIRSIRKIGQQRFAHTLVTRIGTLTKRRHLTSKLKTKDNSQRCHYWFPLSVSLSLSHCSCSGYPLVLPFLVHTHAHTHAHHEKHNVGDSHQEPAVPLGARQNAARSNGSSDPAAYSPHSVGQRPNITTIESLWIRRSWVWQEPVEQSCGTEQGYL